MFGFDVDRYLARIGVSTPSAELPMTGETLSLLQKAHLMTVPYENIDIIDGTPLDLSTDALYQKVVLRNRGGYCFELNGLFGDLLRAMDYGVNEHLARFLYGEDAIPMRRHRVLEVQARDGTYVCDVGIGLECPRIALKMEEDLVQTDGFCEYRLEREPFLGWVLWQRKKMAEWKKFYSFTDELQLSVDFLQPSFYCEKAPDSVFNKKLSMAIKTQEGLVTLDGELFRVSSVDHEIKAYTAESKDDLNAKIKEYFGIERA